MTDQAPIGIGIRMRSPVRWMYDHDRLGTVVGTHPTKGLLVYCSWTESTEWLHPDTLCLDLTDPTGFMHGVWAVAERFGDTSCTATVEHRYGFWEIKTTAGIVRFCAYSGKASEPARIVVPALRNIPSDQPQQALAAIMRHVFGVTND